MAGRLINYLRRALLELVYDAAEYCAPAWINSKHVSKIDVQLNRGMRTISGTLKTTPLPWLPVMANTPPSYLRRIESLRREWEKYLSLLVC